MKKGFTLIELLVALACSSIALAMITTSLILITNLNQTTIKTSSNLYKLSTVRSYITANCNKTNYNTAVVEDKDIYFDLKLISSNTNVEEITYAYNNNTVTYIFTLTDEPTYEFIVILN